MSASMSSEAIYATVHATSVVMEDHAILIRGAAGSGKSDLALRLMDQGARLLSDDQTHLQVSGLQILASPPEVIAGMMEVRGVGVVTVHDSVAPNETFPVALIVDLVKDPSEIERMPDELSSKLCDIEVAVARLYGFAASAPQVVKIALDVALGRREAIR